MFKKCMIAILIITLIISTNIIMFAEETSVDEYVYIINPEVSDSGKTILDDAMFISIYVQSEETLLLEVVKTSGFEFEEDYFIEPYGNKETVEEKISLFDIMTRNYFYTKEEILVAYQIAELELKTVKKSYVEAQTLIEDIPTLIDETLGFTYELTKADEENIRFIDDLGKVYNNALLEFNYWESAYVKLFEEVIVNNVEMIVDPAFPYFEYTVDSVRPGNYQLLVKNDDGNVIEQLNFEVVTEKIVTDEILRDMNFFENIIDEKVFD